MGHFLCLDRSSSRVMFIALFGRILLRVPVQHVSEQDNFVSEQLWLRVHFFMRVRTRHLYIQTVRSRVLDAHITVSGRLINLSRHIKIYVIGRVPLAHFSLILYFSTRFLSTLCLIRLMLLDKFL
jgi:hypothetical protein